MVWGYRVTPATLDRSVFLDNPQDWKSHLLLEQTLKGGGPSCNAVGMAELQLRDMLWNSKKSC
jgi:hypothetical protein